MDLDKGGDQTPWYEARLSVHVRNGPPTRRFGEGGEELAHIRASVEAASFVHAIDKLDKELGAGWERVKTNAELVDQPPSPDVLPKPDGWWDKLLGWPYDYPLVGWAIALAFLVVFILLSG